MVLYTSAKSDITGIDVWYLYSCVVYIQKKRNKRATAIMMGFHLITSLAPSPAAAHVFYRRRWWPAVAVILWWAFILRTCMYTCMCVYMCTNLVQGRGEKSNFNKIHFSRGLLSVVYLRFVCPSPFASVRHPFPLWGYSATVSPSWQLSERFLFLLDPSLYPSFRFSTHLTFTIIYTSL